MTKCSRCDCHGAFKRCDGCSRHYCEKDYFRHSCCQNFLGRIMVGGEFIQFAFDKNLDIPEIVANKIHSVYRNSSNITLNRVKGDYAVNCKVGDITIYFKVKLL